MASASSSALRVDDSAYGSLEALGTPRRKKVPVLVLDPEELERAHQLFQEGAAEQLGEFDPQERSSRLIPLFGLAPIGADPLVGVPAEATVHAASDTAEDGEDGEEAALDAGLPSPEELLARSLEQDALDEAKAELAAAEAEAAAAHEEAEAAPAAATDDSLPLAAIVPINRNTSDPGSAGAQAGDATLPRETSAEPDKPVLPQTSGDEPEPLELGFEFEELLEPADHALPSERDTLAAPGEQPFIAPPQQHEADTAWLAPDEAGDPHDPAMLDPALDGDEDDLDATRATPNSLRARLVREDVSLAHPEPTGWSKVKAELRRWWQGLFG